MTNTKGYLNSSVDFYSQLMYKCNCHAFMQMVMGMEVTGTVGDGDRTGLYGVGTVGMGWVKNHRGGQEWESFTVPLQISNTVLIFSSSVSLLSVMLMSLVKMSEGIIKLFHHQLACAMQQRC